MAQHMARDRIAPRIANSYSEYLEKGYDISVVGRPTERLTYMKSLGFSDFVLQTLQMGYLIPFNTAPSRTRLANNASARKHMNFVQNAIDDLILAGAVHECAEPCMVVNPLSVAVGPGKLRLVLDCRSINAHLKTPKVTIEGAEVLVKFIKRGGYLISFDIKAGYHHIPIHPRHQQFLGFACADYTGRMRYFYFTVLPFGLASATHIFTKVMREFIRVWHAQGLHALIYVDDGIDAEDEYQTALLAGKAIHHDLISAGWIPHGTKCCWEPQQVLPWLGNSWDLVKYMVFANWERLDRIMASLRRLKLQKPIVARELAKVAGSIISLELGMGDLVHLRTKAMQMMIATAPSWETAVQWTEQATDEVWFWIDHLYASNGMSLEKAVASGCVSYSDASGVAAAAIISPGPQKVRVIVNYTFTPEERHGSSTYRELLAVVHGIDQTKTLFVGMSISWWTDCANIVHVIKRGSMPPRLLNLALRLFHVTRLYRIRLNVIWIPRSLNEQADFFSRITDYNDWGVKPEVVAMCTAIWIKPTIDRFADEVNTHLPRFNSRFYSCGTEGVDAFMQDWGGEVNLLVPPIYMVPRVLQYLELCKGQGLLFVPRWESGAFWPMIVQLLRPQSPVERKVAYLGNIFRQGRNHASVFGSEHWRGSSVVLWLGFCM